MNCQNVRGSLCLKAKKPLPVQVCSHSVEKKKLYTLILCTDII